MGFCSGGPHFSFSLHTHSIPHHGHHIHSHHSLGSRCAAAHPIGQLPHFSCCVNPSTRKPLLNHRPHLQWPTPRGPLAPPPVGALVSGRWLLLSSPLDRANVRQREQGRSRVSYLEGWQVIAEANRIFGFDGWERSTLISRCVAEHERPIGRDRKSGWGVTYIARVRITITAGQRTLIREGSGAGHGIDADLGLAHESALKEAETDATKRALMTFGNPFGLALYDKQQRQVSSSGVTSTATPAPCLTEPNIPVLGWLTLPFNLLPSSGYRSRSWPWPLLASRPLPRASALPFRFPRLKHPWRG